MGAELNFSEEAFELGAAQLVGYPIASSDRWDAASDVIRVATPLIVAEGYQTVAEYLENEIAQADEPEPDGGESFKLGFAAGVTEGFRQAKLYLEMRAAELRGEV